MNRNLIIFIRLQTSEKSERIERIGDIHTSLTIYTFAKSEGALIMPSLEGSVAGLYSCNEETYKKMHTLQNALLEYLPHRAGLNLREFRMFTTLDHER